MDIVLVFVVDSEQVFTLWLGRHLSDANLVSHNVNITHFKSILNFYTFWKSQKIKGFLMFWVTETWNIGLMG